MVRYMIASAFLAGAFAAPAFAQDGDAPFAGFRVEAIAGFDSASYNRIDRREGLLYGAGLGYDLDAGRLRFGLEAEGSDSTAKGCGQIDLDRFCAWAGRDLYVGGRVGIVTGSRLMPYAKGGYTNLRIKRRDRAPIGPEIVTHPEFDGLRLGAGAEVAIGANTFVEAEYRYSDYERRQSFDRHQGAIGFGLRF